MEIGSILLGGMVAGGFLFLWGGLMQNFTPWGIRAVKSLEKDKLGTLPDAIIKTAPPKGMYMIANEQVAALVAVRAGRYYNLGRYFALEFATQFAVGILLALVLTMTNGFALSEQLLLVGLMVLLASVAIDFQYWNWWGFSPAYALGFLINRLAGFLIVAFIVANWII